jgi:hypothetical protein
MARPKLWLLVPNHYTYRVEYRFVDSSGKLINSKTWELHHERGEKPKAILLQANARLIGDKPRLEEVGKNYVTITVTVASLEGELKTSVFSGFPRELVNRQLVAYPLTLGIVMGLDGLSFSLFTAASKHE